MGNQPSCRWNRTCFLRRLGSVEVQLILQCLPVSGKLYTARCSRTLLRDAADSFSWGEHDYFPVAFTQAEDIVRFRETRVLRHAPLLLHYNVNARDSHFMATNDVMCSGFHIRGLQVHSSGGEFPTEQLRELLEQPDCVSDLQVLLFDTDPFADAALTKVIVALPVLRSLQMQSVRNNEPGLTALAELPSLTELRILCAAPVEGDPDCLCNAIARCRHLRMLHFIQVEQSNRLLPRVLSFQNLRQLQHLSLHGFDMTNIGVRDVGATVAGLVQLRTLDLRRIRSIDCLLSQLPRASSLTELTIECGAWDGLVDWNPSKQQLLSLQRSIPHLHTTLLVVQSVEAWLYDFVEQYSYTEFNSSTVRGQLMARWKWLQKKAAHTPRVRSVSLSLEQMASPVVGKIFHAFATV